MPNLVHSLDAASLGLLIDSFYKENKSKNFYSIHDCFAVTCNNVNLIYQFLKLSYCQIYIKDSFLRSFDEKFKKSILDQVGIDFNKTNPYTRTLNIENSEPEVLIYPDINKVLDPSITKLDIKDASYSIN